MATGSGAMTEWPWPAPQDDGGASHLLPGTPLPVLALRSTDGQPRDLAVEVGLAVVFVYPWTGRPGVPNPLHWDTIPGAHGSTPEAQDFADRYDAFTAMGAKVFGLSAQSSADQSECASRLALPFALLSDADLKFSNELRLPRFEAGGVTYLRRMTMIVRDGAIVRIFYPVHPPDRHAAEVLAVLKVEEI